MEVEGVGAGEGCREFFAARAEGAEEDDDDDAEEDEEDETAGEGEALSAAACVLLALPRHFLSQLWRRCAFVVGSLSSSSPSPLPPPPPMLLHCTSPAIRQKYERPHVLIYAKAVRVGMTFTTMLSAGM